MFDWSNSPWHALTDSTQESHPLCFWVTDSNFILLVHQNPTKRDKKMAQKSSLIDLLTDAAPRLTPGRSRSACTPGRAPGLQQYHLQSRWRTDDLLEYKTPWSAAPRPSHRPDAAKRGVRGEERGWHRKQGGEEPGGQRGNRNMGLAQQVSLLRPFLTSSYNFLFFSAVFNVNSLAAPSGCFWC